MTLFLSLLGGFGVAVLSYLLITFYMRRTDGVQPGYRGLLLMAASTGCVLATFYVLRRFEIDVQHGQSRVIFWLVLGIVWLVLAVRTTYQRQSSGSVLMDLGPAPMFKLHIAFAILTLALAVRCAIHPESRAQAFAYITWSVWLFVMARGRFQVRERGIVIAGLLPWNRIMRCVATADNTVRLNLKKGFYRTVDVRLPADRRDAFIQLVNPRMGAKAVQVDSDSFRW